MARLARVIAPGFGGGAGVVGFSGSWKEYVGERGEEEEEDIRRATTTGRPWVEGKGLSKLDRLTGRDLKRGKSGRPSGNVLNSDMSPEFENVQGGKRRSLNHSSGKNPSLPCGFAGCREELVVKKIILLSRMNLW